MIETAQTVCVAAPIGSVWNHVKDIRNWARLMPGLQDCTIIDGNDSRWVLKVGVGAMVRTVKVAVHVDQWDGPGRVLFSFKLQGDPVTGEGCYLAMPREDDTTNIQLSLQVSGTGPMAPMWEAMGGPLLPKFARAFAEQRAGGIEEAAGLAPRSQPTRMSWMASLSATLSKILRRLTGWRPAQASEARGQS